MLAVKSAIQLAVEGLSAPPRSKPSRKLERVRNKRKKEVQVPVKTASHKTVSGKRAPKGRQEDKMSSRKQMMRAIKLHSDTLKKLFSSGEWTAREAGIMTQVDALELEVSRLKDILDANKVRRIRDNSKPKSTSSKAVMNSKTRHHSTKVYISPEKRAANKAIDGKPIMNLSETSKATRLHVVGGSPSLPNVPVKNAKPGSRKQRLKKEFLDRQLVKEFALLHARSNMEAVSKAA